MKLRANIAMSMALSGLLAAGMARANNLALTNVTLKPLDDTRAFVRFDLRWENSWRHTNINHDAAWVFFKIKPEGRSAWEHVTLETNGHVAGTGTPIQVIVPEDRVGCFIRRSGEGSGTLSVSNVKVAWNFSSNGLVKTDRVRLQACAVEMVYVAEGSFWVGSGGTEAGSLTEGNTGTTWVSGTTPSVPFRITNEAALIITNAAGNLWATASDGGVGTLSSNFPKGYAAFYCMKYEITQGQYRDFLNSLTRLQQTTRTVSQAANWFALGNNAAIRDRNGIRCPSSVPLAPATIIFGCDGNTNRVFNETDDAMDRACNWLSWMDGCAFADWAGLRPMTELEYEKACRGPLPPVANEYAWGDAIISATTVLLNDGTGMESASNGNCNYIACTLDGPYRAGIYATAGSARQSAGASYWGIMELSGNGSERAVTVGHATGRLFTGQHGDGNLNAKGNADVAYWPGLTGGEVIDFGGAGLRGGSWFRASDYARVSDRISAATMRVDWGNYDGWRGVCGVPSGVGP